LPKNLEGAVVCEAESVEVRGKTRIPTKNSKIPEMTVPISLLQLENKRAGSINELNAINF